MELIHYSGVPGSGITSLCLVECKHHLNQGDRVFWISGKNLDPERFSQIMNDLSISNASKFHLMKFNKEQIKLDFETIILQVTNMCNVLKSTRLIVIDDWDYSMERYEKSGRIESISRLVDCCSKNDIKLIITSKGYDSHEGELNKLIARSSNELSKIGFENNIVCKSAEGGTYSIINPEHTINYKIIQNGIEFIQ